MDETRKLNALEEGGNVPGKVFSQQAQPSLYEQAVRAPARVKLITAVVAACLFLYALRGHFGFGSTMITSLTLVAPRYKSMGGHWPGYAGLSHVVILGDSYSETAFIPDGPQPSYEDPLGNPSDHAAWTSANGPNWAIFLPTIYNSSFLRTINLAAGGATIDQELIPQYHPEVRSLKKQVLNEFIPRYGGERHKSFAWAKDDTLFIIWIGINDIHNSFTRPEKEAVQRKDMELYATLVESLYGTGARNFLFLNVPPTDLSPLDMHEGPLVQSLERADITLWNKNVLALAQSLHQRYLDVSAFVFDTNALFTQIIKNPCSHPETCAYKETAEWCVGYKDGTKDKDGRPDFYAKYDTCEYAIDEYFWKDALHPTFRVHNATAKMVANFLKAADL